MQTHFGREVEDKYRRGRLVFSLRVYFPFSKLKKKKSRSIFNLFGIFYQVNNRRVTDKEEANKLLNFFVCRAKLVGDLVPASNLSLDEEKKSFDHHL